MLSLIRSTGVRSPGGVRLLYTAAAAIVASACLDRDSSPTSPRPGVDPTLTTATTFAPTYAPELVATAASGFDMNDAGSVVGSSYRDVGCGSFCLPPQDQVFWRGGQRLVLPGVAGWGSNQHPLFVNNQDLIVGYVGVPGTTTKGAIWRPSGGGFTASEIPALPGLVSADVAGVDEQGRVVGWASTGGAIPSATAPYMWSQATGTVNLAALGYPNVAPSVISRGGRVATTVGTYLLGDPTSFAPLPAPPAGYTGAGRNGSAVNDAGDQAHFLITIGSQNLLYPFRLAAGGTWQQISTVPTGRLSRAGMGDLDASQDLTLTIASSGAFAEGPNGSAQGLSARVSAAYPGAVVTSAGSRNATGQILASVMVGRSARLMRLTPVTPCVTNCALVSALTMTGQFVQDPALPGSCIQGGRMYNLTHATLTLTTEGGAPLGGATVYGRFLDDYWTDSTKQGATNASGVVTVTHQGLCGVGAIAFLVDSVRAGTRSLDRTRGILTNFVIPSTSPPTNQPPVASFIHNCSGLSCSFDGRGSTDDVGITAWRWTNGSGVVLATTPTFARTFRRATSFDLTLTVTDGGGLTNSTTKTIAVGGTTPNQPPVANWTYTCTATHRCTFDGSAATDPDGHIVSYAWTNAAGKVLATSASFTRQFARAATVDITLTVTDNNGLSDAVTKAVTIP